MGPLSTKSWSVLGQHCQKYLKKSPALHFMWVLSVRCIRTGAVLCTRCKSFCTLWEIFERNAFSRYCASVNNIYRPKAGQQCLTAPLLDVRVVCVLEKLLALHFLWWMNVINCILYVVRVPIYSIGRSLVVKDHWPFTSSECYETLSEQYFDIFYWPAIWWKTKLYFVSCAWKKSPFLHFLYLHFVSMLSMV